MAGVGTSISQFRTVVVKRPVVQISVSRALPVSLFLAGFSSFSSVSKAAPSSVLLLRAPTPALHNFYRYKWNTEVHVSATRWRILPQLRVYCTRTFVLRRFVVAE